MRQSTVEKAKRVQAEIDKGSTQERALAKHHMAQATFVKFKKGNRRAVQVLSAEEYNRPQAAVIPIGNSGMNSDQMTVAFVRGSASNIFAILRNM